MALPCGTEIRISAALSEKSNHCVENSQACVLGSLPFVANKLPIAPQPERLNGTLSLGSTKSIPSLTGAAKWCGITFIRTTCLTTRSTTEIIQVLDAPIAPGLSRSEKHPVQAVGPGSTRP